jgi:hypothetical protein
MEEIIMALNDIYGLMVKLLILVEQNENESIKKCIKLLSDRQKDLYFQLKRMNCRKLNPKEDTALWETGKQFLKNLPLLKQN